MASNTGIRFDQIKIEDRHGTQLFGQASDGTGTSGNVPIFNADGSLTDGGLSIGSIAGTWIKETPTGVLNAVNTTFTLSHTPNAGTLIVYLNGDEQDPARWVTVTGTSVVFTVAPIAIDYIIAHYAY
jgi:hypothetical protein